ncbi:MAG TPA: sulfotransferase family 2 domain-containing protein [Candidatus Paceibacterota bacterium]|nr:sulfotransferase family 2 domain-containing protein [Candidatus Paceibacterota bacterium]
MKIKYNFLHIPKTAGSTFRMNVLANKSKDVVFDGINHETIYNSEHRNITFIRHPIARTISHYNEVRNNTKEDLSFEQWFGYRYYNFQTKWLLAKVLNTTQLDEYTFEKLKKALKTFYFVGLTEHLDSELNRLLQRMGLKRLHKNTNVASKRYIPTERDKALILNNCDYDLQLYDFLDNQKIN